MPAEPEELDPTPTGERRHAAGTEKSASAGDGGLAQAPKVQGSGRSQRSPRPRIPPRLPPDAASPALPAGSSGLAVATDGVLLRYNVDQREWERLTGPTPVSRSDRLLCLSPFRATVTLGKIPLMLVGETEIRILSQSSDKVPAIELIQGRLLVRNPPSSSLKVGFSDRTVTLEVSPSSTRRAREDGSSRVRADRQSGPPSGHLLHPGRGGVVRRPETGIADGIRRRS